MDNSLFRFIWRYSRPDQIRILAVVLLSLPFYFLSLELPKTIVNKAIQGEGFEGGASQTAFRVDLPFAESWWGESVTLFSGFELDRLPFLILMSLAFLALVIVNGLFKLSVNTAKGRIGERMLRRLRYMLFDRILRFPIPHFRKVKAPEISTMIKDEVEPLGGFIGDAFVLPVFLGGQAITALAFIIFQNVWLGLIAGGIALLQTILIPRMRAPILKLGRERQLKARALAGHIGEVVDGIAEVHVNDTSNYERAEFSDRLGRIFWIRFELFQKKFLAKFVNNFLAQLTPFLFYLIGGYFAIRGSLDVGQLVAVIVAYKDLPGPMKQLIDWDQRRLDTQIKYEQVISQFAPDGMLEPSIQSSGDAADMTLPIEVSNLTLADGDVRFLEQVSLTLPASRSVALTGKGTPELLEAIARLRPVESGTIRVGGRAVAESPSSALGRQMAYVGQEAYLTDRSVFDTLAYALLHAPEARGGNDETIRKRLSALAEAHRAGNPEEIGDSDWIDYEAAGATDMAGLREAMIDLLRLVELDGDLYDWGLRAPVPAESDETQLRRMRAAVFDKLSSEGLTDLVVRFEPDIYNDNATLADNLLFGVALAPEFSSGQLSRNPTLRAILAENGLEDELVRIGREIAETMVEIFGGVDADAQLFERFSLFPADDMPLVRAALDRAALKPDDQARVLGIAFRYIDSRHRLDVLDDALRSRIISARKDIREALEGSGAIAFYDADKVIAGASLLDNFLFGRISEGMANVRERVTSLVREVVDEEGRLPVVLQAGLAHRVGRGGRELSASQRHRIVLARALMRRPEVLVVNTTLSVLDDDLAERILQRILDRRRGKGTLVALSDARLAHHFDSVVDLDGTRLADTTVPQAGTAAQ